MTRMHRPPFGLALLVLLAALAPAACTSHHVDPDQPQDASIREFRATHYECNPHFYRTPCQIGPDGKLYEYNPGEHDPP
jgi:hypothetical protein